MDGVEWLKAHVFPAHAGMSPRFTRFRVGDTGFPRPRGDEPFFKVEVNPWSAFSPPTRG